MKKAKRGPASQPREHTQGEADPAIAMQLQQAVWLHQQGQMPQAEALYRQVLRNDPKHFDALHFLGLLYLQTGQTHAATESIRKALKTNPNHAVAHSNISNAYRMLNRHAEALASCDRALELAPDYAEAHNNRGNALRSLNRHSESLDSYDRALAHSPGYVEALFNRGAVLILLGRHAEALEAYDQLLKPHPGAVEVLNGRGNALHGLARYAEALQSYDRAIQFRPDYAEAWNNRGNTLLASGKYAEAVASYDRALELKPDYADAWSNRGNALVDAGRHDDALASYDKALRLRPRDARMWDSRGNILVSLNRHQEAAASFAQLLEIAPDFGYAIGRLFHSQLHSADWSNFAENTAKIVNAVDSGKRADAPFSFLSVSQAEPLQLQCASIFVEDKFSASANPLWTGGRYDHDRIRVAYLSADFHNHATAYLMAGLFESHSKARFETTAISFGPDADDDMRKRVHSAFDCFIDVREHGDREVAMLLKEREIDIAVDLKGFTSHGRTGILAHRPAPIQVNYLGYPGTLGAGYIDFIVADRHVIPPAHHAHYAEKVVYLPDSYQVNDARRRIAERVPSRAEAGLPEQGFVFCCFNNSFKITPEVFDIWARLLHAVSGSVLWLLEVSPAASDNLRREAVRRGIPAERLVFASKMKLDQHLARHALADLFLDTLPYNAHTTASDALWAGLPVLTCIGNAFAGRVAASLLHAVGMPELITDNLVEYEAMALRLATTPALLAEVRNKLSRNRTSYPLFDTGRFCRHIEAAYIAMWERHQAGERPAHFSVPALS
jgi:predicted O-linked N-acetylglucosamine transferase (SPINDLY family)